VVSEGSGPEERRRVFGNRSRCTEGHNSRGDARAFRQRTGILTDRQTSPFHSADVYRLYYRDCMI